MDNWIEVILAIALGGFFGYALYMAGASNPSKITAMLRLQYLTLMKIIVFAIGFASFLLAIANLIGAFNVDHFNIKNMNLAVIIGGLIFGFGFGWAGTCPGTCVAATSGSGFRKALSAVIGGLLGAYCFALTYRFWKRVGLFKILDFGKVTLFKISDKYSYILSGSFWGLLATGLVFMISACLIRQGRNRL